MGFGELQTMLATHQNTARHFFALLLAAQQKLTIFFVLGLVNAWNKAYSLRVYSINEQIIPIIITHVHLRTHVMSLGSEHIMD